MRLILFRREVFLSNLREQARSITSNLPPHNSLLIFWGCPLFHQDFAGVRRDFCHHVRVILHPPGIASLHTVALSLAKRFVFPLTGDFLSMSLSCRRVLPQDRKSVV